MGRLASSRSLSRTTAPRPPPPVTQSGVVAGDGAADPGESQSLILSGIERGDGGIPDDDGDSCGAAGPLRAGVEGGGTDIGCS